MSREAHPFSISRALPVLLLLLLAAATGCLKRHADLDVSTEKIDLGTTLTSATFTVKNGAKDAIVTSGVTPLEYQIKDDRDWLSVEPVSGRLEEGQLATHTVRIDRSLLPAGDNEGHISFDSNGGNEPIVVRASGGSTPPCTTPPAAPSGPAPASGATGVPPSADLGWSGGNSQCAGLTATYDVRFGTSSPPPFDHDNGTAKTWDPGTLANSTTYYWQIVAKDPNGSTAGPIWSFTTAAVVPPPCTAAPAAPTIVAPANGAASVAVDANVTWSGGNSQCAGLTATYDVRFGTSSPPPFDHDNGTAKTWDPGTLANSTTYYWQIVAKDANGSTAGPVWSFTTAAVVPPPCTAAPAAPTIVAPANGAASVAVDANVTWSGGNSQCAGLTATYDVRFGTSSPPPFDHDNGTAKTWDPGTLANATTYYWQIVAKDANGSTPGPIWSFTTAAVVPPPCTAAPAAPTIVAPANGATSVAVDANVTWSGGNSQCAGLTATYDVRFGTSSPPPLDHNNGTAKSWDPGTLAYATTYYWRIVAKDANGSTAGSVWSFTTTAAPAPCDSLPQAPCTPNPENERTNVNENANLAWSCGLSQCTGLAPTYDVYFGTNPTPGAGELLGNTAARAWNLPPLQSNVTYYWQVVVKDANGSTPGPIWRFRTRS